MGRSFVTRMVIGLFALAVGVAILGSLAGFWDFGALARGWWALLVIVPGLAAVTAVGFRFWNVTVLLFGLWLLAGSQEWLGPHRWLYLAGGLLVLAGVRILLGALRRHRPGAGALPEGDGSEYPRWHAVCAARVHRSRSANFRGGRFRGVCGSLTVDLRDAAPAGHAVVNVAAVLGGVTLLLPRDTLVRVAVTPVFGTVTNLLPPPEDDGKPMWEVRGSALFGVVQLI